MSVKTFLRRALAAVFVAAPLAAMSSDEGDIKYRQSVMRAQSGHAGAIAQIARGNVSHTDALEGHARALHELSKMVPAAFENQTTGESRARANIWTDRAGFAAAAGDFEKAAMATAEASKNGPDAVKATLGDLFDTCKACHREYRVKDD